MHAQHTRPRSRLRLAGAALALVALLASGCSSNTKSRTSASTTSSTASSTTGVPRTTVKSSSTSAPSDTGTAGTGSTTTVPAQLRSKLLSVSDLPGSGWKESPVSPSSDSGSDCVNGDPTAGAFKSLAASGEVDFQSSGGFAAEKLGVADESTIERAYTDLEGAMGACVGTNIGDSSAPATLKRRSLTVSGVDQSAAFVASFSSAANSSSTAYVFDFVLFRKGPSVVLIGFARTKAGDADLKKIVGAAVAKL